MINDSLDFIAKELNNYFKSISGNEEDKVIVSNIINPDGSFPDCNNKLTVSFINMEKDTGIAQLGFRTNAGQSLHHQPLAINLQVLIAAGFQNYSEGLEFISSTFIFFYTNPIFQKTNNPGLSSRIDQLSIILQPTNHEMNHHLWTSLGAKHIPYLLYNVRVQAVIK